MGSLGYVPNVLHMALDCCVTNKHSLIHNITVTITKGTHAIWLACCKTWLIATHGRQHTL
jgi:hypothetical protein